MSDGSTDQPEAHSESVIGRVGELRHMREELERAVLPLATSVDGRQFTFQASLHGLALQTGGYVVLERDGQTSFGQILTLRPDSGSPQTLGRGGRVRLSRSDWPAARA